jgi:lysozyme
MSMINLPNPSLPWPIAVEAVNLIAEKEGCRLRAYKCPAGIWTIGWGRIDGVVPGMSCSQALADQWLCDDLTSRTVQVLALLTVHAEPNALGALVSLAYNIGVGALAKSTVLRAHNAGNPQAAARAFSLWDKARVNGVLTVLAGLTARRAAEAALYLKPEGGAPIDRMPQAVAAETSLAASPIAQGGVATASIGALSIVQAAGEQAGAVGAAVESAKTVVVTTLGVPAEWFVPVLLLVVGAAVFWHRYKQRKGGWA